MLHPLSGCTVAELEEKFTGKLWAFTPVMGSYGWQLGISEANLPGYSPVPGFYSHADTYDEMSRHADELNVARGHTIDQAMNIVASSMAQGKIAA